MGFFGRPKLWADFCQCMLMPTFAWHSLRQETHFICSSVAGVIAFGEHVDVQTVLDATLILAGNTASFLNRERDLPKRSSSGGKCNG